MAKVGKNEMKRQLVRTFLENNPTASNAQVCMACNVSNALVGGIRKALISKGVLQKRPDDQSHNRVYTLKDGTPVRQARNNLEISVNDDLIVRGTEEFLKLADSEAKNADNSSYSDVPPEEMMRIAAKFMRDDNQIAAVRFAAMNQYQKIKADMVGRDALGPGAPLTVQDQVIRLHFLLKAVGFRNSVKAMEMAFSKKEADEPTTTTQSGETDGISGPAQAPSPERHDSETTENETVRNGEVPTESGNE